MQFLFQNFFAVYCDAVSNTHFSRYVLMGFSLHFALLVLVVDMMQFAFHTFIAGCLCDAFCISNI